MNKISRFILDIFFPNRCPICRNFIDWNKFICGDCEKDLEKHTDAISWHSLITEFNSSKPQLDRTFICFYYEGKAKDGILSLKDGHKEFGYYLGNLLGEKILESQIQADAVVPVPMSKESYRKRGYNQAEIIAQGISSLCKLPLITDSLIKNKSAVQHTLELKDRIENASAYSQGKQRLDNLRIILCDDVITTGSTMNICAKLIKELGASYVFAAAGTTTKLKKE